MPQDSQHDLETLIQQTATWIKDASSLVIAAGAGIGVDSGLPDFRGNEGFWRAYPPMRKHRLTFYQAASPQLFEENPRLAWGFYAHRLNLYRKTQPHNGFHILKDWTQSKNYFIFTSNVDGHFQKAGFSDKQILECHGSIHHLQCMYPEDECVQKIWSAEHEMIDVSEDCMAQSQLPNCPCSEQLARPNILMFNDTHWISSRTAQQETRYEHWIHQHKHNLVVIEIGAGTSIPTVRHAAQSLQDLGAKHIRINPEEEHSFKTTHGPDICIGLSALAALKAIDENLLSMF